MSLARLPLLRLVRSRLAWLAASGCSGLVFASVLYQRRHESVHGADRALDLYATGAVPLLVYMVVAAALGHDGLARLGRSLVRLGAPSARMAWMTVLVIMLASGLICGVLGASTVAWAHGSGDPPIARDALETLAFGALAGAAYAAYFLVGAAWVASFWGRALLLVVDWMLGSTDGVGALLTPRAHLRNLLGGEAPFDVPPWQSLVMLGFLTVVFATWSVRRAARVRV